MIVNTNSNNTTKTTMASSTTTASTPSNSNTMATTTATHSNNKNSTAATVTTTNLVVPPPPPPPRPITSSTPRVQHYHRSGWSKSYHRPPQGGVRAAAAAAAAAATPPPKPTLEKIKEEEPSSRSLAYDNEELSEDVATIPQPEPQQQQLAQQPTCRMESFMLGHEYQYKLLATTKTSVPQPTTTCCFVPLSTIGSSGLLSSLQGQPPFVVVTDDDDDADDDTSNDHRGSGHDSNAKYCVVGVVEQHPSYPDDESNDSSDYNDDGDESMFWMATLNKNQSVMSARVIHLRGSEMIRFVRKMQYEDLSLLSSATKRHFLVYSMNEKAFVLKNSNDIVKSIQESTTCSPVEDVPEKEQVNKDVVEVKVTETETALATKKETEDLDDYDDDETTQDGAVNASLDVLVPSDIMKPFVVKSTTSSPTNKDDKSGRGRRPSRRRSIKVKWMKLMKGLLCLRQRGGSGCGSGGGSSSTIAVGATTAAAATDTIALTATCGEISPGASTLSSSSSSTTATQGYENIGAETKKDGHYYSDTNIVDV